MTTRTKEAKRTKKSARLTLGDRLSRLAYRQACQLLGPEGDRLIRQGARYHDLIDIDRDVYLRGDLFRLVLRGMDRGKDVVVTVTTMAEARNRLYFNCDACRTACEHVGAAASLILEEKTALGLAAVPDDELPLEHLTEEQLVERALAERRERARTEKFRLRSCDPKSPWADYAITSALSGKTYRVALRGEERGQSFCSCPDFRTNTLGTCKHVLYALDKVRRRFPASARRKPPRNRETFVHVL